MTLTIAIPTYNRPRSISNTIKLLLPQLNDEVCVKVLDNCSDTPVKDVLEDEFGIAILDKIEVIRHPINIGADVNFQRCFEYCETEYIWMLGDDDTINENAVDIILDEINKYKGEDFITINFKSNCLSVDRPQPVFIKGIKELSEKLDHFGNWLFISACVHNATEYRKNLYTAPWGAYAGASQLIPAMHAIKNNKPFILSEKYIVTNVVAEDVNQRWSDIPITLGILTLLEVPVGFTKQEYLELGKKMSMQFVSFTDLLCAIIKSLEYDLNKIDDYHLYIVQQVYYRTLKFRRHKLVSISSYNVVSFLLRNKAVLQLLVKNNKKLRRRIEATRNFVLFKR